MVLAIVPGRSAVKMGDSVTARRQMCSLQLRSVSDRACASAVPWTLDVCFPSVFPTFTPFCMFDRRFIFLLYIMFVHSLVVSSCFGFVSVFVSCLFFLSWFLLGVLY